MNRWWVESIGGEGRERRIDRYGNSRISKRICVWRCYSVNECWTGADISRGEWKKMWQPRNKRFVVVPLPLCFSRPLYIESSSRHPSFLFDENFLMDRSDFQSPSNRILVSSCGNLKGTTRVAVVYNYLSAWVTNGRSYFGRKSGLTRDAVQRLLLLDDRYLTCFFKKKKTRENTARV